MVVHKNSQVACLCYKGLCCCCCTGFLWTKTYLRVEPGTTIPEKTPKNLNDFHGLYKGHMDFLPVIKIEQNCV